MEISKIMKRPNKKIDPDVVHICEKERALLAVACDLLLISWGSLTLPLGRVDDFQWEISQHPQGYMVKFNIGENNGPWFVTDERTAEEIRQLLLRNASK